MKTLAEQLEALVDEYTLAEVLDALSSVCSEKANHLMCNWQDHAGSRMWDKLGTLILKVGTKADELSV